MAKNLQSKLKSSDKISIFDINTEAVQALETDMKTASSGAAVEIAASAFDASKDAVSPPYFPPFTSLTLGCVEVLCACPQMMSKQLFYL